MDRSAGALTALLGLTLHLSPPLSAQEPGSTGLRYTTLTRTELGGMFAMMTPSGSDREREEVTFVDGLRIRQDAGDASIVMDFETGTLLQIDHASRTYRRGTLGSLQDMLDSAAEGAGGEPAAAPSEDWDVTVSVEPSDETEEIAGHPARRVLVTVEARPTGSAAEQDGVLASVLLMDMWVGTDPSLDQGVRALSEQSGGTLSRSANVGAGMTTSPMFSRDPGLQMGMARLRTELETVDGLPLRSTLRYVTIPMDQEFDREQALGGSAGGALADLIKDQMEEDARDEANRRIGRLGGLIGRRLPVPSVGDAPSPEGPVDTQTTLMTIVTELRDVEVGVLDDGVFQAPEGYEER